MKTLRIVATLVTGGTLVAGGVMLTLTGQPAVMALGAVTALVGAFYAFAGLTLERVLTTGSVAPNEPLAAESSDDHLAADAGALAGCGSPSPGERASVPGVL